MFFAGRLDPAERTPNTQDSIIQVQVFSIKAAGFTLAKAEGQGRNEKCAVADPLHRTQESSRLFCAPGIGFDRRVLGLLGSQYGVHVDPPQLYRPVQSRSQDGSQQDSGAAQTSGDYHIEDVLQALRLPAFHLCRLTSH